MLKSRHEFKKRKKKFAKKNNFKFSKTYQAKLNFDDVEYDEDIEFKKEEKNAYSVRDHEKNDKFSVNKKVGLTVENYTLIFESLSSSSSVIKFMFLKLLALNFLIS